MAGDVREQVFVAAFSLANGEVRFAPRPHISAAEKAAFESWMRQKKAVQRRLEWALPCRAEQQAVTEIGMLQQYITARTSGNGAAADERSA